MILADSMVNHFFAKSEGDFYYTADDHEQLIMRTKNFHDGPQPSATAIAILNLLKLAVITNNQSYKNCAELVLNKYSQLFNVHPSQFASMITAWDFAVSNPISLILITTGDAIKNKEFVLALYEQYSSNKIAIFTDQKGQETFEKSF